MKSHQQGNNTSNKVTPDSKKMHTNNVDTSLSSTGHLVQGSDQILTINMIMMYMQVIRLVQTP